jgi:hypothetical protein
LGAEGVVFTNWLPTGERFNSGYFCVHVLRPLAEILHLRRVMHSARSIVHVDNATPHRAAGSEECFGDSQLRHAPQPPYSPDISPCDFFLFDALKTISPQKSTYSSTNLTRIKGVESLPDRSFHADREFDAPHEVSREYGRRVGCLLRAAGPSAQVHSPGSSADSGRQSRLPHVPSCQPAAKA